MKHWEESWKSDAQWRILDEVQDVSSGDQADVSSIRHSVSAGDETLCWMLDITSQTKWF